QTIPRDLDFPGPDQMVKFSAASRNGEVEPVNWSLSDPVGSVDGDGWYKAPGDATSGDEGAFAIQPDKASISPGSQVQFSAGISSSRIIHLQATSKMDPKRFGVAVINVNVIEPQRVRWT